MNKKLKFAKAQRTAGASTSAEHGDASKSKRKGVSKKTIIGASLLAAGAGALYVLGRRNWPAIKEQAGKLKEQAGQVAADLKEQAGQVATDLKGQAGKVAADLKEQADHLSADLKVKVDKVAADLRESTGKAGAEAKSAKSDAKASVDVPLTDEVAQATKSSPKAASGFTDEGATGNND
ncbi:hypothetical protein [Hymenobacter jeollabukensis]|uniref:YtxH domain-containing protein n=1 Tax=Hymenobacter jeollabukensis TaxID=2025313 RepID=A0A5R8WK14_9BACT|nr:hypothetical protein [Hymenobacter jeollabukensis]TLM89171.1 hypothetical protein FDY95_21615 [Hymenobacter jeollabukensis]